MDKRQATEAISQYVGYDQDFNVEGIVENVWEYTGNGTYRFPYQEDGFVDHEAYSAELQQYVMN